MRIPLCQYMYVLLFVLQFQFTTAWPAYCALKSSSLAVSPIDFSGQAKGGLLTLANTVNRDAKILTVNTYAGETKEAVSKKIVVAINATNPFGWWFDNSGRIPDDKKIGMDGSTIIELPGRKNGGSWVLGGTETGLGIPPPPCSLCAEYNEKADKVFISWINPAEGYDSIAVLYNGISSSVCPGETNQRTYKFMVVDDMVAGMDIVVVGYRKDVPSNAAVITVTKNSQEEMASIPFTNGIAPNWSMWTDSELGLIQLEQGDRGEDRPGKRTRYGYPPNPEEKRFFQTISSSKSDAVGGIWRKFMGLTPGHTYRLHVRLNCKPMDASGRDWSASVNMAYNNSTGEDLTIGQLSGKEPLPNGLVVPKEGCLIAFGPDSHTNGEWKEFSTTENANESGIKNITMPEGVTTLTVWFRCTGLIPEGIGFDWIKLEDVTTGQK